MNVAYISPMRDAIDAGRDPARPDVHDVREDGVLGETNGSTPLEAIAQTIWAAEHYDQQDRRGSLEPVSSNALAGDPG